ncbi:MAG: LamG-like jellyroll fold domain-containing protein, partial [Myxococcota bacterium]|nr:LamG-like jellyroll fold domain-containing protein [Myxococcota bacterium]
GGGQTGILRHVSLFGAALEPGAPHQDLAMGILPVGSSAALIAYWPLDEGAGIHALDRTGHGNNGELSPATPPWADLAGSCVPSGPPTCASDADPTPVFCQDLDGDGLSPFTGDCNDDPATDGAAMAWGADELCDGIDNNCDGFIDQIGPNPPLLSEWMLPFEGCADDTICQGSLGCIQGTPCSSPLFVDDGDDDPSSYVGVDVASDLSMGGAPGATVATWYQRKAQPWYHGWAISTPTLRLRVNGHGLPEAYVRLEDGEEGCTADWQGAISSHNGEVSAPWMDGNWHFVAVTWDGTSLQIWNNAMEAMTLPLTDTPTALESGCEGVTQIGYRIVEEATDWNDVGDALPALGSMRHLSLWSAALTPSGLQALAQGNLPGQDLE